MRTNIDANVHFTIFGKNDNVADGFVGLRHYPSDLFVMFVASELFHDLRERANNALESLKILIPDLRVEFYNVDLKDYWGVFFKTREVANEVAKHAKKTHFYANITTWNRIAAVAVRDALATVERPAICYYYVRGKGEEERSEIIEVPVPRFSREINKAMPILRSLYEKGGRADSIEEIAKDIGKEMSRSNSLQSRAKLVEYYIRKLEVYAVVRTIPGKKREVMLTGAPSSVRRIGRG